MYTYCETSVCSMLYYNTVYRTATIYCGIELSYFHNHDAQLNTRNNKCPLPQTHTHYTPVLLHLCTSLNAAHTATAGTVCTEPDTVECVWWSGFCRCVNDVHMYCYINYSFMLAQTIKPKTLKITSISLFPVAVSILLHLKANGTFCGSQLRMYQPHYNRLMYGTS